MTGVNLIPCDILAAHLRRRRIRLWIGVGAAVAAVASMPAIWQISRRARQAELSDRKAALTTEVAGLRADVTRVNQALADLNERIERADALRSKRPWAGLLALTAECMPQEVWLTGLTTDSASGRSTKKRRTTDKAKSEKGEPEIVVLEGASRLTIDGFALEHQHVYDFMARLKGSNAFSSVQMVKGDKEPVLWSEAVRFRLICSW